MVKLTDKDTQRQFAAAARDKIQQYKDGGHNFKTVAREFGQLGEELLGKHLENPSQENRHGGGMMRYRNA